MKTMKKGKSFARVSEDRVHLWIADGWKFCSKLEWKKNIRDYIPTFKVSKAKASKMNQEQNTKSVEK